jgi:hypothetical protein
MRLSILFILFVTPVIQQEPLPPDQIVIGFNDSINSQKDCVLKLVLTRKDKKEFHFPNQHTFGEATENADLVYKVEKLVNGRYEEYRCNESPIAIPTFESRKKEHRRFTTLQLIDSLANLDCIDRGEYRMQVLYNNRGTFGLDGPNITVASNWVKFVVNSPRLRLGYSRYIDKR